MRPHLLFSAALVAGAVPSMALSRPPAMRVNAPTSMAAPREQVPVSAVASALAAVALSMGGTFLGATPAMAATATSASGITFKLPPISDNPNRCNFQSSAMGQANAARDSLYDLRQCKMSGLDASGFDLSGVIASDADFSKTKFRDAQLSKGFLVGSKFDGADFTNGIVDRADFEGASLRGAVFENTVLTSTSFEGADLTDADFSEAYLGDFDLKKLCKNPTLKGENPTTGRDTQFSAGCKK